LDYSIVFLLGENTDEPDPEYVYCNSSVKLKPLPEHTVGNRGRIVETGREYIIKSETET
jgi:hypothetical protein